MDLDGLPVTLLDMAGLRDAGGRVEALGVARARGSGRRAADLRVFLVDDRGEVGCARRRRRPGDLVVLGEGRPADRGRRAGGVRD